VTPPRTLKTSDRPLVERYDCAMLDLDGVVYRGPHAIDGVPELLHRVTGAGMSLAFVTNNAARTPSAVAGQLRELGVPANESDVVTSAQAAARELTRLVPRGARVLVVGGEGLRAALEERGLEPVGEDDAGPAAVVQGFHPDVGWRQLANAAYRVADGLPWVASNLDRTIPTADGIAPGNGMLVAAVEAAVGRSPDVVAGKPYRPLFDETVLRTGSRHPIVVGDRLDTDIEGANSCGADSLLVMTGVTDVAALCAAPNERRPTYVDWTLAGLLAAHDAPRHADGRWTLDGWVVVVQDARLEVSATGGDRSAGLRAVTAAAWHHRDRASGSIAADLDVRRALRALDVR
jgi:HAD superfamily hydrolase (TIGR01450 family)